MLNKSKWSFGLPVGSLIILYFLSDIISVGLSHWRYLWVSTSCILFNQVDDLFDNITTVRVERKKEIFAHRTTWKNEYWHYFHMSNIGSAPSPLGSSGFFSRSKMWRHVDFLRKKWVSNWKKTKKIQKIPGGNIPFLTVYERFCMLLSRKDMAFSGGFRTKMSVRGPILRRNQL